MTQPDPADLPDDELRAEYLASEAGSRAGSVMLSDRRFWLGFASTMALIVAGIVIAANV
jgi:hypothetical protein